MIPRRYGPLPYVPITRRPKLTWPGGARVALWVNPNIEFFGLDDVMPGNLNERVPREHAKIPNVKPRSAVTKGPNHWWRSQHPKARPCRPNPIEPPWYVTRMPGGVGGVAPRGVPLSRSITVIGASPV